MVADEAVGSKYSIRRANCNAFCGAYDVEETLLKAPRPMQADKYKVQLLAFVQALQLL